MAHCHRTAGAACSGSIRHGYGKLQRTRGLCSAHHAITSAPRLKDSHGRPAVVSPAVLAADHTRLACSRRCRARHSVAAAFALADRAQVSTVEKQQAGTADASQLSHLDGLLRVIGVGPRGAAGVERLLGDGRLRGADLWVVDESRRAVPGATCVALHPDRAATDLRVHNLIDVIAQYCFFGAPVAGALNPACSVETSASEDWRQATAHVSNNLFANGQSR